MLLSLGHGIVHAAAVRGPLRGPNNNHPIRPNTPVLTFGVGSGQATFIDPTVQISSGKTIVLNQRTFVAPYARLDGNSGYITIGSGTVIGDNARLIANPGRQPGVPGINIGNGVVIGVGATVLGPSTIGGTNGAIPTYVGAGALIDGATLLPGSYVSALARVGPGVTVPAGVRVLPGVNVTTDAEASNPALGKVVPLQAADVTFVTRSLSEGAALAAGYTNLYQGNSATGTSGAQTASGVFNGNLSTVEGSSSSPTTSFATGSLTPRFLSPTGDLVPGQFYAFRARVTGNVQFHSPVYKVAHHLGRGNSIRGDEGQPIIIGSIDRTGNNVTIRSPVGGTVTIGENFRADDGASVLGGPTAPTVLGDNVSLGAGSLVSRSTLGTGTVIGPRAYVADSTLAPGTVVPAGTILIANRVVGSVQW